MKYNNSNNYVWVTGTTSSSSTNVIYDAVPVSKKETPEDWLRNRVKEICDLAEHEE